MPSPRDLHRAGPRPSGGSPQPPRGRRAAVGADREPGADAERATAAGPAGPAADPVAIGAALRDAREHAGLDVATVVERTRIRGGLIRAIEAGDFAACGGAVYTRGHLRAIAAAIGVAPAPFVAAHDAAVPGASTDAAVAASVAGAVDFAAVDPLSKRDLRARRGPNWLALMAAAAGIVAVAAGADLVHGLVTSHAGAVTATRTVVPPAAVASRAAAPAPAVTTTAAPPGAVAEAGVSVHLRLLAAASWIHVVDETGRLLYQGVLPAGSVQDFHATTRLAFVIGNAGAVDLNVNGRELGVAGPSGQVVNPVFGPGGAVNAG